MIGEEVRADTNRAISMRNSRDIVQVNTSFRSRKFQCASERNTCGSVIQHECLVSLKVIDAYSPLIYRLLGSFEQDNPLFRQNYDIRPILTIHRSIGKAHNLGSLQRLGSGPDTPQAFLTNHPMTRRTFSRRRNPTEMDASLTVCWRHFIRVLSV
jgi:hypothetical protein